MGAGPGLAFVEFHPADRERAIREYGAADGLEQNMDKLAEYVIRSRPAS